MDPTDRTLPAWIEAAYETLVPHISHSEGAISPADAEQILLEETNEDIVIEPADAETAVQHLLNRGYLYEVDGKLRITDPEPESATEN